MADRFKTVLPGEIVIEVDEDAAGVRLSQAAREAQEGEEDAPAGLMDASALPEDVYRRGRGRVNLYDAGKILQIWGSDTDDVDALRGFFNPYTGGDLTNGSLLYADIPLARVIGVVNQDIGYEAWLTEGSIWNNEPLSPTPEAIAAFLKSSCSDYLIGSIDGTTKVRIATTNREVRLAAPIPYNCNRRFLRFRVNEQAFTLGDPEGGDMYGLTPSPKWTKRDAGDEETAAEPWRVFSRDEGQGGGILTPERKQITRLGVEPLAVEVNGEPRKVYGVYESFDTDDTDNFRIVSFTEEGEETPEELALNPSKPVNVFLTPRLQISKMKILDPSAQNILIPTLYQTITRIPTTPYLLYDTATPADKVDPFVTGYVIRNELASISINAPLLRYFIATVGTEITDLRGFLFDEYTVGIMHAHFPVSPRNAIVATIEQGTTKVYVLRNTDRFPAPEDLQPYFRTIGGIAES